MGEYCNLLTRRYSVIKMYLDVNSEAAMKRTRKRGSGERPGRRWCRAGRPMQAWGLSMAYRLVDWSVCTIDTSGGDQSNPRVANLIAIMVDIRTSCQILISYLKISSKVYIWAHRSIGSLSKFELWLGRLVWVARVQRRLPAAAAAAASSFRTARESQWWLLHNVVPNYFINVPIILLSY